MARTADGRARCEIDGGDPVHVPFRGWRPGPFSAGGVNRDIETTEALTTGMHRRRFLERAGTAAAAVGGTTALAGCSTVLGDEEYDVGMVADGYRPDELTVSVGDTVVWENTSSRTHTVTAYEGGIPEEADYFASGGYDDEDTARDAWSEEFGGALETGDRFSHTFTVPGQYEYVCVPHEFGGMYATVIVEE